LEEPKMGNMKLVLLEDVENLGLAGEEISVSAGYARNFLLPRSLAARASGGILRQLAARKEKIEEKRKLDLEKAQGLSSKITETEIIIQMEASDDNHLFGSVSPRLIAEKLAAKGVEVDHQRIKLDKPIKELGSYQIGIKLHTNVSVTAKVNVVRV
jgi:large subunit ribosomal protein L9